jgi:hypothetical protein
MFKSRQHLQLNLEMAVQDDKVMQGFELGTVQQ